MEKLARCLFPLGGMDKSEVRAIAERAGFLNHRKKDSTGICFIGERRFDDFLAGYLPSREGEMRDPNGRLIGRHRGLAYYTIGQRQGLGIGGLKGRSEAPWFVADKVLGEQHADRDPESARSERHLAFGGREMNWLVPAPDLPIEAAAKIRYRQADQACRIVPRADGGWACTFTRRSGPSPRASTPASTRETSAWAAV